MPRSDLDDDAPISPRLKRQRTIETNRARAQIWLACETLGAPHISA
jgi:hypothetical protein